MGPSPPSTRCQCGIAVGASGGRATGGDSQYNSGFSVGKPFPYCSRVVLPEVRLTVGCAYFGRSGDFLPEDRQVSPNEWGRHFWRDPFVT